MARLKLNVINVLLRNFLKLIPILLLHFYFILIGVLEVVFLFP